MSQSHVKIMRQKLLNSDRCKPNHFKHLKKPPVISTKLAVRNCLMQKVYRMLIIGLRVFYAMTDLIEMWIE